MKTAERCFVIALVVKILLLFPAVAAATPPAVTEVRPDGRFVIRVESVDTFPGATGEVYYTLTANGIPRTVIVAEFKVLRAMDAGHFLAEAVQQRGPVRKDHQVRFFPAAPVPAAASSVAPGGEPPPPAQRPDPPSPPAPAPVADAPKPGPAVAGAVTLESFLARMVYIPGGTAEIGLGPKQAEFWNETPAHRVTLGAYYIDRYEVSYREYAAFLTATAQPAPPAWPGGVPPADSLDRPVTGISWPEAAAYAKWCHRRLPTEAEWEYAGRGPDRRLYPWGDSFKESAANLASPAAGPAWPVETASGDRSHFGVQHLAGNVSEWTQSPWEPYPGNTHPEAYIPSFRIVRGGASTTPPKYARLVFRAAHPEDFRMSDLGFRTAIGEQELQALIQAGLIQVPGAH